MLSMEMIDVIGEGGMYDFSTPPPPLHTNECGGGENDLERMRQTLEHDPQALQRVQYFSRSSILYMLERSCEVSPLYDACYKGHFACVQFLIESGAQVNMQNENYDVLTAIDLVYLNARTDSMLKTKIVKYLFSNGAVPNLASKTGYILPSRTLIRCIESGHNYNKVAKLLLENKSVTEKYKVLENGIKDILVYTNPVQSAIHFGNVEGYKLLLLHGANNRLFNITNKNDIQKFTEYAIPQYIINSVSNHYDDSSCISTNHVLEMLHVYREFGGNLWVKDKWGGSIWGKPSKQYKSMTALEHLRRTPKLMSALPDLDVQLERMMQEPLSLQCIARLTLRNCMGRDYWRTSQELPLPRDLKNFLLFGVE